MGVHYYNELLNFFTHAVRDGHEAQDLVQNAFERLLSAQHAGQRTDNPRAMLYQIARNLLVDRHRHLRVRQHDGDEVLQQQAAVSSCEPDTVLAGMQRLRLLADAIEALPPRCRAAFVRHRIDGLSHADVAAEMGISVNMVERHVMLAVAACRKALAEDTAHDCLPPLRARWLPQAAASVAALCMLAAGWGGWRYWQSLPVFEQHYASARGQQLAADLPDGSHLQFDTATSADVTLYRQRRQVRLSEGQVLFQVQGDRARPFDVLAGTARITVVGTRFVVRHTPGSSHGAVQVAVLEGRVRVQSTAPGAAPVTVELLPGQTISADALGRMGAVGSMPVGAMADWLAGRLNFDNVALADVLAELARYGDSGLAVRDAHVAGLLVTASVELAHIDRFARSLPLVLPVRLMPDGRGGQVIAAATAK